MKIERPVTIKNPKRAGCCPAPVLVLGRAPDDQADGNFYNYEFGIRILARPVAGR
jgi:hypothetical protein